jgi:hypothetical protein
MRLHGVVLNYLSTRTTLPLPYALRRRFLCDTTSIVELEIYNCKQAAQIDLLEGKLDAYCDISVPFEELAI